MKNTGLGIYSLFVVSWFLHFAARLPLLGAIRFDLLLVLILSYLAFTKMANNRDSAITQTDKVLRILVVYSIVTIPFVEWPGSVINSGFPNLIRAIVFYYFTVAFVKTEKDLKKFVFVFLACQSWRILEPLYLHITQGYWGAQASMSSTDFLDRLSGAPSDIVNPNGLAFIVCTALPFLYFLASQSWKHRLMSILLIPLSTYVLVLTGSRSGMIGLGVVLVGIIVKSKNRLSLSVVCVLVLIACFPFLSPDMQDRYLSIVGMGEKNAGTSEQRTEGAEEQFRVALRRPIFGHGLGTSAEANSHFTLDGPYAGYAIPAHNLYLEIAEELGFVGVVIFLFFMKSIYSGFVRGQRAKSHQAASVFLAKLTDAMQVWLAMNFVFSFASYGLSSYEWYLFGGFSVVMQRLARNGLEAETASPVQVAT